MKIVEKGGYKKMCFGLILIVAVSAIFPLLRGKWQRSIGCVLCGVVFWVILSVLYVIFLGVTKPLQKSHIKCPNCNAKVEVPDEYKDKEVKCLKCKKIFKPCGL